MPAKKPTKKSTSKKKSTKSSVTKSNLKMPTNINLTNLPKFNSKSVMRLLIALVIILTAYRIGPWLFPAIVGNKPVSRIELYRRMELAYGAQTLDDLINERILQVAIKDSGITVPTEDIEAELQNLEDQFSELGGLEEALKQRGITKSELTKQITTQIAVEIILEDKIAPSEDDIQQEYTANLDTLYDGKTLEEVSDDITEALRQANLRDAFLEWFAEAKQNVNVKNLQSL